MCGIYCSVASADKTLPTPSAQLVAAIRRRGPDSYRERIIAAERTPLRLHFAASVLSLRGSLLSSQPLQDEITGSILCWNGEAWHHDGKEIVGCDGDYMLRCLVKAAALDHENSVAASVSSVLHQVALTHGPFAFVFFDAWNSRLYFGRDPGGRRSLLMKCAQASVEIASVGDLTGTWEELESGFCYIIDAAVDIMRGGALEAKPMEVRRWGLMNRRPPSPGHLKLHPRSQVVSQLEDLVRRAVEVRISTIPYRSRIGSPDSDRRRPRVAVLFSGGLDCTILARIIHDCLPIDEDVDLLNVAFFNPRIHNKSAGHDSLLQAYEQCPDRKTARASHVELRRQCPGRHWRLIEVNVSEELVNDQRHDEAIKSLIYPSRLTEMDISIARPLYFAARGIGEIVEPSTATRIEYETPARVLFSGLGADELFGGYQRHARALQHGGYPALFDELHVDIQNIGKRNCGRDDRIISHWGKEIRQPFLDDSIVAWACSLPVEQKLAVVDVGVKREIVAHAEPEPTRSINRSTSEHASPTFLPDKTILRILAHNLGLIEVAGEKKRAIQFGSRSAKMVSGRTKGTDEVVPV